MVHLVTYPANQSGLSFWAWEKLGGLELNYSSDIDLILIYEADGQTNKPRG